MMPSAESPSQPGEIRSVLRKVYVCYFFSGSLGLIYQILWLRKLLLVFGSTVHAVSAVLTVFFGGLALGSWLLGRLIDRDARAGLRWYALLEVGIGLYAFLTPTLFEAIQHLYIPLYRSSGFSPTVLVAASCVCSTMILLLPTTLMGGTFPVVSRFLIRSSRERGIKIAALYGINTAGAMAGTIFVYFLGLPILGLFRTLFCAGVLSIGIGLLCLLLDRHLERVGFHSAARPAPLADDSAAPSAVTDVLGLPAVRWLGLAFGLSGFSAMVYEVAWTRALSLVLGSSIYAFCVMLATFLGGMAIGSLWMGRDLQQGSASIRQFIRFEWVLAVCGLMSIALFNQLPQWFVTLWPLAGRSFTALSWLQATLSAAIMLLPTITMGALFPVVSDLVTGRFAQLGRRLGSVYALNTLGGILGSFLSGFVLIPSFGLPWAIVAAAGMNALAAVVLAVRFRPADAPALPRLAVGSLALVAVGLVSVKVVVPTWKRQVLASGAYLIPSGFRNVSVEQAVAKTKLLYYRDSFNATVSVHQSGEDIFLRVGGKTDASNQVDMGTQVLLAHIPLLLHRDPKSVLVIGLGSGVTLGSAGRHPVSTLHCAELDPAVIEAARFFKDYNFHVHDDPRATIFAADGRNVLLASPRQYDVIISEPSNPWMAGLAYLFTKEFYQLAKQRLAPAGVMCQWVQLYHIFPEDVKLILKTFHGAFPYVSAWSSIPGDVLLVGSMEPQRVDLKRLAERMAVPSVQESLKVVGVTDPEVLLQLFLFSERQVEELTADTTWVHEDDQPQVEFRAPKALYVDATFKANVNGLEAFRVGPEAIAPAYAQQTATQTAEFHRALATLWRLRREPEKEQRALEQAAELQPTSSQRWVDVGEAAMRMQKPLRAREAFVRATQLDPANTQADRWLARLAWREGRLQDAQSLYERAAGVKAPDGEFAEEIGNCLFDASQFGWAAEYYRSALSQGGGARPLLVMRYAKTLLELKTAAAAERMARFGIASAPTNSELPLLLGEALLEQGKWQEAAPVFARTLAASPQRIEPYYGLGRIAMKQGRRADAARYLKEGLRYSPYHHETLKLLQEATRH